MPSATVGQRNEIIDGKKSQFYSLKSKGDSIVIRVLDVNYVYDCKHFVTEMGQIRSVDCQKIFEKECNYCTRLEEIKNSYSKEDLRKEEVKNKIAKTARDEGLNRKFNFYYKVLNRNEERLGIFKATLSVKLFLDTEVKEGIDITRFDYKITRTEESPSKFYVCTRIDSSMSKPLSDDEKAEILGELDLERIIDGKSHSD